MRTALLIVALVLFAAAGLVSWTSNDPILDVLRDCTTLVACGLGVYVASHLVG